MVKTKDRRIESIVISYLWDLPGVVTNPEKLLRAIERYKKGKTTAVDTYIIRMLKNRLPQTEEGKKLYREFFNEEPPEPEAYFIPPEQLLEMLEKVKR
jgi:hypothetical protein